MNQNSISRYENGEREADYETLIKFADYFGTSIDYLLGRTDDPTQPVRVILHGDTFLEKEPVAVAKTEKLGKNNNRGKK